MTEDEIMERAKTAIRRFDSLRISGPGWSGNSREGFAFNPESGVAGFGGGGGTIIQTGACCLNGECFVSTQTYCTLQGGTYIGNGSDCTDVSCGEETTGACCVGGNCSIETPDDCTGMGGTYQGDNTTCDPNPCTEPPCPCGGTPGLLGEGHYLVSTFHQTRTSHAVGTPFVDECDLTEDISTITTFDPVTCDETVTCSGTFTYHSPTAGDCSASWVSNGMGGCIQDPSCNNCLGGACDGVCDGPMIIDSDTHESCSCSYSDVAGNTADYFAEVTLSSPCTP